MPAGSIDVDWIADNNSKPVKTSSPRTNMKTLALALALSVVACTLAVAGSNTGGASYTYHQYVKCKTENKWAHCAGPFTPYDDGLPLRGQENGTDSQQPERSVPEPSEPETPACD